MTILSCPMPDCEFETDDVDVIGAAAILNIHANVHTAPSAAPAAHRHRSPKLERPKIGLHATTEDWNAFQRRWQIYRVGSDIDAAAASTQLLECAHDQLTNVILRADPDFTTRSLDAALGIFKSLAVVPVALGVIRSELSGMRQDPEEPFRTFAAHVQGKAEACDFKTVFNGKCSHCDTAYSGQLYYTDEVVRDVLLNGVSDVDIRREALSTDGMQHKPINEVIAFIESKETARNANPSSGLSAISAYRRTYKQGASNDDSQKKSKQVPSSADREKTSRCPDCGKSFNVFTKKLRGWNTKPHERCAPCWKTQRDHRRAEHNSIASVIESDSFGQVAGVTTRKPEHRLHHQIFNRGEWRRAKIANHPAVNLTLHHSSLRTGPVDIAGIADTGAQSDLWSLEKFLSAGFREQDLSPVRLSLLCCKQLSYQNQWCFLCDTGRNVQKRVIYSM